MLIVCGILSVHCKYDGFKPKMWFTFISNNNNNHDDIYSAVIMTEVIARVHSVPFMNVEQRQAAVDPQTKPPDLGCESACRMLSSTTTIAIYYYYSAQKMIHSFTVPRRVEGWVELGTAGRVHTVYKAVNHSGFTINTTAHSVILISAPHTLWSVTVRPLRPAILCLETTFMRKETPYMVIWWKMTPYISYKSSYRNWNFKCSV